VSCEQWAALGGEFRREAGRPRRPLSPKAATEVGLGLNDSQNRLQDDHLVIATSNLLPICSRSLALSAPKNETQTSYVEVKHKLDAADSHPWTFLSAAGSRPSVSITADASLGFLKQCVFEHI
jgi:hypothetical protein